MWLSIEYWFLFRIFIGLWNDGNYDRKRIRNQKLRVAGIGGPLRSGFDAGIGRETVVPMGRGKPGAKDRATGKRLKEREEDVDSPYRWGRSCNIRVSLEIRDFCVRNKGLWRVKPRSSGGKRPDFRMRKKGFFSFLSCLCRFKGVQGNELIYILIYLF